MGGSFEGGQVRPCEMNTVGEASARIRAGRLADDWL
jgi:hypothetical protein